MNRKQRRAAEKAAEKAKAVVPAPAAGDPGAGASSSSSSAPPVAGSGSSSSSSSVSSAEAVGLGTDFPEVSDDDEEEEAKAKPKVKKGERGVLPARVLEEVTALASNIKFNPDAIKASIEATVNPSASNSNITSIGDPFLVLCLAVFCARNGPVGMSSKTAVKPVFNINGRNFEVSAGVNHFLKHECQATFSGNSGISGSYWEAFVKSLLIGHNIADASGRDVQGIGGNHVDEFGFLWPWAKRARN